MVRDTSIKIYNEIKNNGLLSKRRFQVYEVLFDYGPLTGAQVARIVIKKYGSWGYSETIRNRLTELRDWGCVSELDTVVCPISGNSVNLWDVTLKLPKKPPQKVSKLEKAVLEERKACAQVAWDAGNKKIGDAIMNRGLKELF